MRTSPFRALLTHRRRHEPTEADRSAAAATAARDARRLIRHTAALPGPCPPPSAVVRSRLHSHSSFLVGKLGPPVLAFVLRSFHGPGAAVFDFHVELCGVFSTHDLTTRPVDSPIRTAD